MQTNKIYILSSVSGSKEVLKIGITNDIDKRLKSIRTGNPEKVELMFLEELPKEIKVRDLENWLHSVFGFYRMEGEWFSGITVKEVRKKIFNFLVK